MNARRVSAVILAGGRSTRFGRDKLAEPVAGRPLLQHAIEAVTPLATEVLVVAAPDANPALPAGVTLVHDAIAYEGPLAGLLTGLRAAREPVVLVVGGDMPTLVAAVIESMLRGLDAPDVDAVILEADGRARPLPMVVRRERALAAAERLVGSGERRLGALPEDLVTRILAEATWRAIDPEGRSIRDIDRPADLS